jgi:hypothetical protein
VSGSHREFAADTSFLINLISTRIPSELMDLAGLRFVVPPIVYTEMKRDRAELDRLILDGRASVVELPASSAQHRVSAGIVMDDGEADVVALGLARNCGFATDDGCSVDYLTDVIGVVPHHIVGICDLLKEVGEQIGAAKLRELLARIRKDARFAAPRRHAAWWRRVVDGGNGEAWE